jgi:HPt (histidine-containing phosphotransfer) domain-containing protein
MDLQDLIPSFLENRRNEIESVERALATGDFEFVRRLAHTLKGICRPYGFVPLEEMSIRLEAAGEAEEAAEVRLIIGEMRAYVENVEVEYVP